MNFSDLPPDVVKYIILPFHEINKLKELKKIERDRLYHLNRIELVQKYYHSNYNRKLKRIKKKIRFKIKNYSLEIGKIKSKYRL